MKQLLGKYIGKTCTIFNNNGFGILKQCKIIEVTESAVEVIFSNKKGDITEIINLEYVKK